MKTFNSVVLSLICMGLMSCTFVQGNPSSSSVLVGKGDVLSQQFEIGDVKELESNLPVILTLTNGEPYLEISARENILDNIVVYEEGSKLKIQAKQGVRLRDTKFTVVLSCSSLENLVINGAAELKCPAGIEFKKARYEINGALNWETEGLKGQSLELIINGAANCEIDDISLKSLILEINGAANCELSGKADKTHIDLNGTGKIDLEDLMIKDYSANVNGIGKIVR